MDYNRFIKKNRRKRGNYHADSTTTTPERIAIGRYAAYLFADSGVCGGDVVTFTYDNITYTVIDETNKAVDVMIYPKNFSGGAVTIPSTVSYNGKDYTVTKIGVCAFYLCGICVDPIIHQSKFKK